MENISIYEICMKTARIRSNLGRAVFLLPILYENIW